jgi:hypothetical protein
MRDLVRSFPVLLLLLPVTAARAQSPAAPEAIVNTYTTDAQGSPSVSADPRGGYVVVWDSNTQDGSNVGVFGQRFEVGGAPVGAEFRVNANTLNAQSGADVAVDAKGDFIVSWTDFASGPEIVARRFDRSGAPLGAEFQVNAYTTGIQGISAVAADPAGNFVVVWQSNGQDGDSYGIFGRRVEAGGALRGTDFQVNTYVTGNQRRPDVAFTADGGFVVTFDGPDTFAQGIHARRYDASGVPVGAEIPVATALASQSSPAIAPLAPAGFVVAWTSYSQDGSHNGVFARMFDASAAPVTGELAVNSYTSNGQQTPTVAADGRGGFVVAWDSFAQDGSDLGVFAQRFDSAGARLAGEFAVHAFTTGAQSVPAAAADSAGNFVVAWSSALQDGSGGAVVSRRFQGLAPAGLEVSSLNNGVLEPFEVAQLQMSWRNTTTAAQSPSGLISGFGGPIPATYTIGDATATYGAVAPGAIGSCLATNDCYIVAVTATPRPAVHWDASLLETLSGPPAALGIAKRWSLHVGDSFADVPRTNPFYRFVETLLHHQVTGGCAAAQYCPLAAITREQMAVFVLVAREGPGYLPAACTVPAFADVPASSPFCRWIEELARRGVVAGCGGGNYCPASPVTREAMAVFVLRALDGAINPPACVPPNIYADVPETSPFCRWIEELTTRGVATGCGGGNYCPTAAVTREQMGVFISVTFSLTLYGP